MKILYFDCPMGAAGDMLCAALWELIEDEESAFEEIKSFIMPEITVSFDNKLSSGMCGTHMTVKVNGEEEGVHSHNYVHRTLADVLKIIDSMKLDDFVCNNVFDIYKLIAAAEAEVHNTDNSAVHFHEVGMLDAIADVTIFCFLLSELQVDKIIVSPINTGKGTVKCAHGILPVPAPATANILKGVPCYNNSVVGELCTPTGAAILKHIADDFNDMPQMTIEKVGVGIGAKEFDRPNCVRAFMGNLSDNGSIVELACNIDDMTGEELAFAADRLRSFGAADVTLSSVIMKKGRPATELKLLCKANETEKFVNLIFKYTTTLGIRHYGCFRYTLDRHYTHYSIDDFSYLVKNSSGYGTEKSKIEYEDIKRFAIEKDIDFREARKILELYTK